MPVNVTTQTESYKISNKPNRNDLMQKILIAIALFLVVLGIGYGVYYYLRVYRNRETFPVVKNQVDEDNLKKSGFKEINSIEGKGSIFVRDYWAPIDVDLNVYGDVLNGSNAYILSYPNSVGQIDKNTCKTNKCLIWLVKLIKYFWFFI